MRLATIFALFALIVSVAAGSATSAPIQTGVAGEATCSSPVAASACVTRISWQNRLDRILRSQSPVVWDRCPPGSDKFCPAGTSCCQNAAGEYRCCK